MRSMNKLSTPKLNLLEICASPPSWYMIFGGSTGYKKYNEQHLPHNGMWRVYGRHKVHMQTESTLVAVSHVYILMAHMN